MSNHDETMVSLPKDEQVSRPPDPKPAKAEPGHIYVEERLHYRADIADRTDIFFEKAAGQIDIVFPAPSQRRQSIQTAAQAKPAKQKPGGYLALSRYDATVWQPPLRDDGIPVKIPITGPGPTIETESKITLNYELNPNHKDIPSNPVMVAAKIIDRSSRIDTQSGLDFVEGLRLELDISSEIDAFYGVDVTKIKKQLRSEIAKADKKEADLKKQLANLTRSNNSRVGAIIRAVFRAPSGKAREQVADQSPEAERLQNKLQATQDDKDAIETVLQEQNGDEQEHRDFLARLIEAVPKLNILSTTASDFLIPEVELACLELKTPYIRNGSRTNVQRPKNDSDKISLLSSLGYDSGQETTPATWRFNPERWAMAIRAQRLGWNNSTKLHEAKIYLDLDPPSAGSDQISGKLILYVDKPISKIRVGWSDGKRASVDHGRTRYRTWLQLEFTIDFEYIFRDRSYLLERRLHFEGVVFHDDHIINIRHILNNLRLLIFSEDEIDPANQTPDRTVQTDKINIIAIRQGREWDIIQLEITSHMSEGSHTITYNKREETVTRTIPLGSVDIKISARMTGKSQEINALLDTLQNDLEQYFTSSIFIRSQEESK